MRPKRSYPLWLPVAASLLAVFGFSFGLYKDWQMRQFGGFRAVPAISDDDIERSEHLQEISARNGGMISFRPGLEKDYPEYEVELVRDRKVLGRAPLAPFGYRVGVFIPSLEPGEYQIILYGLEGGQRGESFEYPFRASDR